MPGKGLNRLADCLWRVAAFREAEGVSDGDLLSRFADNGDREAFAALVGRHGPLVWSVCRRMLRLTQDCEEAFQASFLILARRAGSVRKRDSIRSWLYGVAVRVAVRARSDAGRRQTVSCGNDPEQQGPGPVEQAHACELSEAIDEAVAALPERQRLAVLLTYFVGKTNDEAARLLGCPRGTIATLLARARERLRRRLARHGLAPALGGAAWFWLEAAAPAATVSASTVGAAMAMRLGLAAGTATSVTAGLVENVMRSMILAKLKVPAVVLTLMLVAGVGTGLWRASSADGQAPASSAADSAITEKSLTKEEIKNLRLEVDKLNARLAAAQQRLSAEELLKDAKRKRLNDDLLEDVKRKRLSDEQNALLDALLRQRQTFQVVPLIQPAAASGDRLKKIDLLLEEIRKEVDAIRRESKPGGATGGTPPPK